MPRRCCDFLLQEKEVPKKKSSNGISKIDIEKGEILTDLNGKRWKLGEALGTGAFGAIYQATSVKSNFLTDRADSASYVAKIERHSNGPLFVEVNCYLRIGKLDMSKYYSEIAIRWHQISNFFKSIFKTKYLLRITLRNRQILLVNSTVNFFMPEFYEIDNRNHS